jgi:hypothetical protein
MDEVSAQALLACPVGCAFLLLVERDRVPVEDAVRPRRALPLAAAAVDALNPWRDGADRAREVAIERGARLGALAERLVAEPGAAWWAAPFDPDAQVWSASGWPRDRIRIRPAPQPEPWEAYAERPREWALSSTRFDGCSSLEAALATGLGEWLLDHPSDAETHAVRVAQGARVFEVDGPAAWHELCVRYPSDAPAEQSPAGEEVLTPHWFDVARAWDGVHLSLLGLLTTPWVAVTSEAGVSRLWSWDVEGTLWMRDEMVRLRDPLGDAPVEAVTPLELVPPDFDSSSSELPRPPE